MAITNSTPIDLIEAEIHALGDYWEQIGQWQQPTAERALQFMVTEAGEALDALLRLDGGFVRNNPRSGSWDKVDEEVADTLIMALRYFATRGLSAEQAIRDKVERMHTKREFAAQQGGKMNTCQNCAHCKAKDGKLFCVVAFTMPVLYAGSNGPYAYPVEPDNTCELWSDEQNKERHPKKQSPPAVSMHLPTLPR